MNAPRKPEPPYRQSERCWSRWAKAFCVSVGAVVVAAISCDAGVSWAAAHTERTLQDLTQNILALHGATAGATVRVVFNGQTLYVASQTTPRSVSAVMRSARAACVDPVGAPPEDTTSLTHSEPAEAEELEHVACWTGGPELGSLLERVRRWLQTGEWARLGTPRYVLARRARGSLETVVLSAWTDPEFELGRVFTRIGDAPGTDPRWAPRPPAARRSLSAQIQDYGYRSYDVAADPDAALNTYAAELESAGFQRHVVTQAAAAGELSLGFTRDQVAVVVLARALESSVGTGDFTGSELIVVELSGAQHATP